MNNYSKMLKADLIDACNSKGIEVKSKDLKADLITKLMKADADMQRALKAKSRFNNHGEY